MKQLFKKKDIKKLMKKSSRSEKDIVVILENIQYARNVASMFRTVAAKGIRKLFLTGISRKPPFGKDLRKASRSKEKSVNWEYKRETRQVIQGLIKEGWKIVAVEITDESIPLPQLNEKLREKSKVALVFGSEVYGVTKDTLSLCDLGVFIPMHGKGASLNVGVSLGIVLFSLK